MDNIRIDRLTRRVEAARARKDYTAEIIAESVLLAEIDKMAKAHMKTIAR